MASWSRSLARVSMTVPICPRRSAACTAVTSPSRRNPSSTSASMYGLPFSILCRVASINSRMQPLAAVTAAPAIACAMVPPACIQMPTVRRKRATPDVRMATPTSGSLRATRSSHARAPGWPGTNRVAMNATKPAAPTQGQAARTASATRNEIQSMAEVAALSAACVAGRTSLAKNAKTTAATKVASSTNDRASSGCATALRRPRSSLARCSR